MARRLLGSRSHAPDRCRGATHRISESEIMSLLWSQHVRLLAHAAATGDAARVRALSAQYPAAAAAMGALLVPPKAEPRTAAATTIQAIEQQGMALNNA